MTMKDLYKKVDVNDGSVFDMVCEKKTDAVFQFESNLFKGVIDDIQPTGINDAIAITALCRPGPLKAGMPAAYARRKRGEEDATEPLPGTWDFVKKTYGCICYQEQIMKISVQVAGFNTNQSDSIVRKIFAKKKKDKMEMLRRMFFYGKVSAEGPEGWEADSKAPWYDPKEKQGTPIKGACNNGYSEEQMTKFWNDIEGFADYLFNASHAAAYSYISVLTAWLKKYYPVNFMTAVLTSAKQEKTDQYIAVAEKMGIKVRCPDINKSGVDFVADKKNILFGLGKIKGVGESSLPEIMAQRPFASIEDMLERCNKKAVNKRVMVSLIKSGALDSFDEDGNRYRLLNHFYDLRNDEDERLDPFEFNESSYIEFEGEVLSACITYKPWWNTVKSGETFSGNFTITGKRESTDKNGNLMAWVTGKINSCEIEGVIFSSTYRKIIGLLDNPSVEINAKKDDEGGCVISKVAIANVRPPQKERARLFDMVVNI